MQVAGGKVNKLIDWVEKLPFLLCQPPLSVLHGKPEQHSEKHMLFILCRLAMSPLIWQAASLCTARTLVHLDFSVGWKPGGNHRF